MVITVVKLDSTGNFNFAHGGSAVITSTIRIAFGIKQGCRRLQTLKNGLLSL